MVQIRTGQINPASEVWASYVPTFTNLSGGTLNFAKYIQIGKLTVVRFKYTLAGAGVAGEVSMTLPVTANADYAGGIDGKRMLSSVSLIDNGINYWTGVIMTNSVTVVNVRYLSSTNTAVALSSTAPFTWGTGDFIQGEFSYEAA